MAMAPQTTRNLENTSLNGLLDAFNHKKSLGAEELPIGGETLNTEHQENKSFQSAGETQQKYKLQLRAKSARGAKTAEQSQANDSTGAVVLGPQMELKSCMDMLHSHIQSLEI